ncbi:MAG: fumarate/nitrate reduction transcriptional regulator Fnr [Methylococcaceae bacterium]|nr:fumarate/nitrate reduction transcriptional regulator Fnr [Methylococcaceae bacterium]
MESIFQKVDCAQCKLSGVCLSRGLQPDEIKQFERIVKRKRPVKEDQFLFRQEDHSQSLYVVKSGSFRSFIWDIEGGEQTIGFYLPGDLVGLDALQTTDRHHCSVVALETSSVCEIPLQQLNDLAGTIPRLRIQLLRMIGEQIVSDQNNIVLLGNRTAIEKVATFLLVLSQRYYALGYSGKEFNLSMPRHDIANYLGLSLETLSRQLGFLIKHGAISVKHRGVQISDMRLLMSIVEPATTKRFTYAM